MPQLRDEDCIGAWYLTQRHELTFRSLWEIRERTRNVSNESSGFNEHLRAFPCFTYVWKIPKEPPGPTVEHGMLWIIKVLREAHNRGARRESIEEIARKNQIPAHLLATLVFNTTLLEHCSDDAHLNFIHNEIS